MLLLDIRHDVRVGRGGADVQPRSVSARVSLHNQSIDHPLDPSQVSTV